MAFHYITRGLDLHIIPRFRFENDEATHIHTYIGEQFKATYRMSHCQFKYRWRLNVIVNRKYINETVIWNSRFRSSPIFISKTNICIVIDVVYYVILRMLRESNSWRSLVIVIRNRVIGIPRRGDNATMSNASRDRISKDNVSLRRAVLTLRRTSNDCAVTLAARRARPWYTLRTMLWVETAKATRYSNTVNPFLVSDHIIKYLLFRSEYLVN